MRVPEMIAVEGLKKHYGDFFAVNGVSFSIKKNSGITALLGPNGAGKTTTMRLLTGFLDPSAGKIELAGFDMTREEECLEARRKIGYLPETTPLYNEMLVSEYLEFMGRVHGLLGSVLENRARELMGLLELASHFYTPIGLLSKGFRQRVALAATLMHEPEIIILDEPTSGLDPNQIAHIRKLIRELGQKSTLILSTHILQEVEDIADRVIIIHNGRIVADDSTARLRGSSEQKEYLIVAKKRPNAAQELSAFSGVQSVEPAQVHVPEPETTEAFFVELSGAAPEDLFLALGKADWKVQAFSPQTRSLEEIFKDLTGSQGE